MSDDMFAGLFGLGFLALFLGLPLFAMAEEAWRNRKLRNVETYGFRIDILKVLRSELPEPQFPASWESWVDRTGRADVFVVRLKDDTRTDPLAAELRIQLGKHRQDEVWEIRDEIRKWAAFEYRELMPGPDRADYDVRVGR